MFIDVLTVLVGFVSFAIFFLVHLISSRWGQAESLLRSLKTLLISFLGLPVALTSALFFLKVFSASWPVGVCMAAMALCIHGLLCFVYVLSVFGAYEASIRMRLLREIAKAPPEGLSLEAILQRYNSDIITRIRLRRLIESGYIVEEDGIYQASSPTNLFFLLEMIVRPLRKQLGR